MKHSEGAKTLLWSDLYSRLTCAPGLDETKTIAHHVQTPSLVSLKTIGRHFRERIQ